MASKLDALVSMLILIGMIILCNIAGSRLEQKINHKDAEETIKFSNEALVVVDAGHGGIDAGKSGVNGEKEKEINFKISIKIKNMLSDSGISVCMTRENDDRLAESQRADLEARTEIMNRGALLAVSIHQNSYHDPRVSGAQVFYYSGSEEGRKAAGLIQEELNALVPEHQKEIRANDTYYILKNTEIPVVIVECGFLSNYSEAEKLSDDTYQDKIAEAVTKGILQYVND